LSIDFSGRKVPQLVVGQFEFYLFLQSGVGQITDKPKDIRVIQLELDLIVHSFVFGVDGHLDATLVGVDLQLTWPDPAALTPWRNQE
jgi:hypothetical protein